MYPRIKNTAQKVVYAFQCSRRRQQAPREKLFSTGLAPGPASGTVWGPPTSAGARRGAAPAPGASGPAASPGRQRAPDGTSRAGVAVRGLALQGAAATTSHVSGFMASRSGPSGALGLVGLFQENLEEPGSGLVGGVGEGGVGGGDLGAPPWSSHSEQLPAPCPAPPRLASPRSG